MIGIASEIGEKERRRCRIGPGIARSLWA